MFKRIRKQMTTNQILHIANLLKRTRRFLTVVAIFAILLSYIPWKMIEAQTIEDNMLSPLTLNTEGDNTSICLI
jgi:hypothetical protein